MEPEACPLAFGLGREARLKDLLAAIVRDTLPLVADADLQTPRGSRVFDDSDLETRLGLRPIQSVESVAQEIRDRVEQRVRSSIAVGQIWVARRNEPVSQLFEAVSEQANGPIDDLRDLELTGYYPVRVEKILVALEHLLETHDLVVDHRPTLITSEVVAMALGEEVNSRTDAHQRLTDFVNQPRGEQLSVPDLLGLGRCNQVFSIAHGDSQCLAQNRCAAQGAAGNTTVMVVPTPSLLVTEI
jgi:hypothetical protein